MGNLNNYHNTRQKSLTHSDDDSTGKTQRMVPLTCSTEKFFMIHKILKIQYLLIRISSQVRKIEDRISRLRNQHTHVMSFVVNHLLNFYYVFKYQPIFNTWLCMWSYWKGSPIQGCLLSYQPRFKPDLVLNSPKSISHIRLASPPSLICLQSNSRQFLLFLISKSFLRSNMCN